MTEGDGFLSYASKGIENRLVLVLRIAVGGSLDSVFAKATPGVLHEVCSRMLVAFVKVAPHTT